VPDKNDNDHDKPEPSQAEAGVEPKGSEPPEDRPSAPSEEHAADGAAETAEASGAGADEPLAGEEGAEAADEAGEEAEEGAQVVNLDERREPRAVPALEGPVGDALRQSLRKFVLDKIVPKGQTSGAVKLDLDADFLKEHGRELVSTIFQGVLRAVVPEKVQVHFPVAGGRKPAAEKGDEATGEGPGAQGETRSSGAKSGKNPVDVALNFDFGSFLRGLIGSPMKAAAPEPRLVAVPPPGDESDDALEAEKPEVQAPPVDEGEAGEGGEGREAGEAGPADDDLPLPGEGEDGEAGEGERQ
jgi:hypothetical protein